MKFNEDYELIPLLVEAQLVWHDEISGEFLCMTIDLLARVISTEIVRTEEEDGVFQRGANKGERRFKTIKTEVRKERILLGDLKSNFFSKEEKTFYETHLMQLIGGKKAVEQNFPIKVDGVFNLSPNSWRTNPSYTFFEHDIDDNDLRIFDAYWNLIRTKKINVPKGSLLVSGNFKDSNDYKLTSYQEYAEQVLLPQPIEK
jgi:hypothetical protein